MVELCPAAKIPTAQIYIAAAPNVHPKNIPPLYKSATTYSSFGLNKKTNVNHQHVKNAKQNTYGKNCAINRGVILAFCNLKTNAFFIKKKHLSF